MNDKLKQNFDKKLFKDKLYLLGLSGGADSMALFYGLKEFGYNFQVCTIDHVSRDAIAFEIESISKICKENGIVFHVRRVEGVPPSTPNLEDCYRQKRYALFEEVYESIQADGLILGHHADDQIETVLKRILEGSSIEAMQGIAEKRVLGQMSVIRPLLTVRKNEIIDWLKERELSWFEDETNQDCRYLRARMRHKILPDLQKEFGKGFSQNLLYFSEKMRDLSEYFSKKAPQGISGPFGSFYPINCDLKVIEADFIFRELLKKEDFSASREEIKRFSQAMVFNERDIEICRENRRIVCSKSGIFFIKENELICSLERGDNALLGWRGVINGRVQVFLEDIEVQIKKPKSLEERLPSGVTLKKTYSKFKVPPHLRMSVPVIYKDEKLVAECLTGNIGNSKGGKWVLTFNVKKNTIKKLARISVN